MLHRVNTLLDLLYNGSVYTIIISINRATSSCYLQSLRDLDTKTCVRLCFFKFFIIFLSLNRWNKRLKKIFATCATQSMYKIRFFFYFLKFIGRISLFLFLILRNLFIDMVHRDVEASTQTFFFIFFFILESMFS